MSFYRIFFGRRGEEEAVKALKKKGYKILATNYRCRHGEIDIIARDGEAVVFVEVKTRSTDRFGPPQASVDFRKQRKMIMASTMYMAEKGLTDVDARFDVVSIEGREGDLKVEIIKNAFEAEGME